ncbi:hypothetical protein Y032_0238g3290 [Ancylostoma ceylanicum]|uniref:C2H2-type domain-containing protein n=2 Tax=Ancylostoma ceylanicum TaxID=53326 RepID=A0A016SEH9_9BILA|nr:hypothetical protein Y032_0238g3290 [Ancylostoma ceylanicum]
MTSSTSLQMNHVASWIIDDNKHNQLVSSLFDRRSSHTQQDFANDRNESQPTLSAIKEDDETTQTGGGKVFNPEAYCDICQKEFCNKYYLATHRAAKHGQTTANSNNHMLSSQSGVDLSALGRAADSAPSMDIQQLMMGLDQSALSGNNALRSLYLSQMGMGGGSPSPSSLPSSGSASITGGTQDAGPEPSPKAVTPTSQADNNTSGLPSWFSGLLPPQLQQQGMPSNMNALLEQMQAMQNLQLLGGNLGGNMGAIAAALAQNPTAAAAFLSNTPSKLRPQRKHSIVEGSPLNNVPSSPQHAVNMQLGGAFPFSLVPSTSTASQASVIMNPSEPRDDVTPPAGKRIKTDDDEEKAERAKEVASSPTTFKCGDCDKVFKSAEFLEHHKLMQHSGFSQQLLSGLLPQGFPTLPFMLPGGMPQQFQIPDMDSLSALNTPKQPTAVKRQYSSNGKNYCDLCNKEVCNKYFLRTHMLKMHGIVIDENKTVIANIDTLEKERMGTLSFRCDICHTEHKSRHLLRQHKQDVHGVVPLSTPQNRILEPTGVSSMSPAVGSGAVVEEKLEKCPLCERRVPATNLTAHIQNEHTGSGGMSVTQAPASPSLECKFCPSTFKDQMELHLHQINQHTVELLQQTQTQQMDAKKPTSDSNASILRCMRCQYTTRDPRNLEMHVERHERMNEATREANAELASDAALRATTEAALKMMVANQLETDSVKCSLCDVKCPDEATLEAHSAVAHNGLNLTVRKEKKEENDVETDKIANERNSHTSGSMSPSGESLPEGFGKPDSGSCEEKHVMQSFVLRCREDASGAFLSEMIAHLPVRTLVSQPTRVSFELVPHQVAGGDSNPF